MAYNTKIQPKQVAKRIIKTTLDNWNNLITGLGGGGDKTQYTEPLFKRILQDTELESIYLEDGLGARIVDLIPDDMFREGWSYEFPDHDDKTEIVEISDQYNEVMDVISVNAKLREAFYWARLYGGSAILIGALDGQTLNTPLKPTRIRSFEYLRVIDRSDIEYSSIVFQLDPEQPRYGMPLFYPIRFTTASGVSETKKVHYTRIIEIHGNIVPSGDNMQLTNEQRYWGISVLQPVDNTLSILGSSIGSIGHLLDEFSVGKFKMAGLRDIISQPNGEELVKKRVMVNDLTRSVFHSIYLDAGTAEDPGDDYIRENIQFSGIPEMLYNLYMLISACTGYPITRLFGVSPAGLNATGESDMRNYYDAVRSDQKSEAEPVLLRIIRIISEWKKIPEPYIKWNPLQSPSPKEQAEIDKLTADKEKVIADTYQTYINAGILEPHEARFLQFGDTLDNIPEPEFDEPIPPVEPDPETAMEDEPNPEEREEDTER
jgi:phage-related protein (TIGR01555 family)